MPPIITRLDPFVNLAPMRAACRVSVVIPARDEAQRIAKTLTALAEQRELDGTAFTAHRFEILVYANNCTDDTANAVRAVAARFPLHTIHVAAESLPSNVAHIGTARRTAMNAARARFAAAGIADGILAATDADTVPAPQWLAWTLREMQRADAVTGRILIDPVEWAMLSPSVRAMLTEENAYHFACTQLAAQRDPRAYDPWPRHWQRSGPSFAVSLAAYDRAGGVPPVRTLEDIALYDALLAHGARIRHSLRVRVTTSARLHARAPGGFGARMSAWNAEGDAYRPLLVEDPAVTVARLRGDSGLPAESAAPLVPAPEATAYLRQIIARGVSDERATRSSVSSMAG